MSNYPGAFDDEASLHEAVNNFATILTSAINNSQTSIEVASIATLPSPGIVSIDGEVIFYTTAQVLLGVPTLSGCTRGADGTIGAQHGLGARVEGRWVAAFHNDLAAALITTQQVLGVNPQGAFATVAERLLQCNPTVVPFASAVTDWSFTHVLKRLVNVQLYRLVSANTYELFDANIQQVVNPSGTSTVTIILPAAEQGALVFQ